VKTGISLFNRSLVLSLLVGYLFIAIIYVAYLPQYNLTERAVTTISNPVHLNRQEGSASGGVQFHRIFKSVTTNNNNTFNRLKVCTAVAVSNFSCLPLLSLRTKQRVFSEYLNPFKYPTFLHLCALRI